MKENTAYKTLKNRHRYFVLAKAMAALLYSIAMGVCVFFFLKLIFLQSDEMAGGVALFGGINCLIALLMNQQFMDWRLESYCRFLDERHPQLEASSHLLMKEVAELNGVEKLQQRRVLVFLEKETVIPSVQWKRLGFAALLGIGLPFLFQFIPPVSAQNNKVEIDGFVESALENSQTTESATPIVKEQKESKFLGFEIVVTSPAYTKLDKVYPKEYNLEILEGSEVFWKAKFDGPVDYARMIIGKNQVHSMDKKGSLNLEIDNSTFYQLKYQTAGKEKFSNYFSIKSLPDKAPNVVIGNRENYERLEFAKVQNYIIEYKIEDDFLVDEVILQTTISSGSGEQVSFRDSTWVLKTNVNQQELLSNFTLPLPLLKINPGEEIYWQLKAKDNHPPAGQWAQSETFIVHVEDTIPPATFGGSDLGVDLLPEYFRSQRQIIIDTKKLLAEEATISKMDFKERSNMIAHDQKILRLRYGQFLGEEFESASGGDIHDHSGHDHKEHDHSGHDHEEYDHVGHEEEHIHSEDCGHDHSEHDHEEHDHSGHDHEEHDHSEHNHEGHDHSGYDHAAHEEEHVHSETCNHAHEESNHQTTNHQGHEGHNHGPENLDPNKEINPIADYAHFHDSQEEATFFDRNIQTKLRAALNEMWQAELFLRTHQPRLALQYEHTALKLIKEIQQDSRVYVERVGVDLPELKLEKRLTGEFKEVTDKEGTSTTKQDKDLKPLNTLMSLLSVEKFVLNQKNRQEVNLAKQTLLKLIGEGNAPVLNALKKVDDLLYQPIGSKIENKQRLDLLQSLQWILEAEPKSVSNGTDKLTRLESDFLKRLY